jgi:5,6,7,8-tetrahydromethanopterin hydro-lyase
MEMRVGEAMAGQGEHRVHINLLLGSREGPVGHAFAAALAAPRPGHIPFLVVLRPNVPVRPATLFVNKAEVREEPHATISWGAGEAGIAEGVREAIKAGALAGQDLDTLAIVVSIWIDPAVTDEAAVLQNTRAAMRLALLRADGKAEYEADFLDDSLDAFNSMFAMQE